MEETLLPIVYNESVVLTSIVNGLIATSILWTFWTPFIVFLVVPLVNAQIKDQICFSVATSNINVPYMIREVAWQMYLNGQITMDQNNQIDYFTQTLVVSQSQTDTANSMIATDTKEILGLNLNLMISMGFAALVIVVLCMGLVMWMIGKYNLNGPRILKLNLMMALVIMVVEMGFFGGVAMQYIPFDPPKIIEALVQRIVNYLN